MLAIAAVGLVAAWLYAIAGSTEQLRALSLPAATSGGLVSASQPSRVVNRAPATHVDAPPERPLVVQESADPALAEGVETDDSSSPQSTGPINGAAFSALLDSGLLGEEDDSRAAEELRNALRAAEAAAEPE